MTHEFTLLDKKEMNINNEYNERCVIVWEDLLQER